MSLEARLTALSTMPIDALRQQWRMSIGNEPPRVAADLLRRMLGHALQEKALGGLTPAQRLSLRRVISGKEDKALKPGMRLVRQWNGRTIAVTVEEHGFTWQDRTYRSLSAIAREVTGTAWSGPRFFGSNDHG